MHRARAVVSRLVGLACHPLALAIIMCAFVAFTWNAENQLRSVPFAVASALTLSGLLFVLSRRLSFSLYLAWMIVVLVAIVSTIKYKMKGFSLHFYDAVFVARDADVVNFLLSSYLYVILPVLVAMVAVVFASVVLFKTDRVSRWPIAARAALLATFAASTAMATPREAFQDRYIYYLQARHISGFVLSLFDIPSLFLQAGFEQRLQARAPEQPFPDSVDCGTGRLPDIFYILQESQTDPAIFRGIAGAGGFLQRLTPTAGQPHPMTVETFGGGTWITNLTLMSGLSATDFGWRSPYLTITLEGRVRGALPELLARCGYRTAVLTPMDESFVNEGPFLKSIGVETVLDLDAIRAPSYHERDDFYYRAAEAFVARHRIEDGRPLFLEIQTIFAHSPYEDRLLPGTYVDGEPFASDPGVNEYMRRMAIARADFETFLQARVAEAVDHPAVVLEFGDHQSFVTRPSIDAQVGADAMSTAGSLAYRTFYGVTALNHPMLQPMPDLPALDVGFVTASLLHAAGLPMSPAMTDLVRLRDLCGGRFHMCPDRDAVDRHLRRRVDSGLLDLFPLAPLAAPARLNP